MTSLGSAASITGVALLPAGLTTAGGITLGAGALVMTVGILMIRHDSATYRPGSANHFEGPSATDGVSGGPPPPTRSPLDVYPDYECSWASRLAGSG